MRREYNDRNYERKATEKQMKQVIDLVTGAGLTTQTSQDNGKTVIGLIGDTEKLVEAELTALEGVEKVFAFRCLTN